MIVTSPALERQAPACGLQHPGTLALTSRANRANLATRLKRTTASLRSPLICAGRPKIGLQPLTTTPC